MELKDLIGKHFLSGVDFGTLKLEDTYYDISDTMSFIIDGKTYTAIEDPSDGYRSCMKELKESENIVKNTFKPIEVLGVERIDNDYYSNEIIDFIDCITGKIVLSVGTSNCDDYYPFFVATFNPENMSINS